MVAAPDYQRAHRVVVKARGPARLHPCIGGCGRMALEWAFQPEDSELRTPEGWLYSHDPDDYAPMCRRCHLIKDRARCRQEDPEGFHRKFVEAGKKAGATSALARKQRAQEASTCV